MKNHDGPAAIEEPVQNEPILKEGEATKPEKKEVNPKVIHEDWVHYIKYIAGSDIPNHFFENPSFTSQVMYEDVDKSMIAVSNYYLFLGSKNTQ